MSHILDSSNHETHPATYDETPCDEDDTHLPEDEDEAEFTSEEAGRVRMLMLMGTLLNHAH